MSGRKVNLLIVALVVVAAALAITGGFGDGETTSPDQGAQGSAVAGSQRPAEARFSRLPALSVAELPPEAVETLQLIASGGPYPFDRDDLTFQNREGLLPDRPRGHYREYTVITPGENDRGARRIVAGEDGELYYTADHYGSFSEIGSEEFGQ